MSPTSYQTAPPRSSIIAIGYGHVKRGTNTFDPGLASLQGMKQQILSRWQGGSPVACLSISRESRKPGILSGDAASNACCPDCAESILPRRASKLQE